MEGQKSGRAHNNLSDSSRSANCGLTPNVFPLKIQVLLKQATLLFSIDRKQTVLAATLELGNFQFLVRFQREKITPEAADLRWLFVTVKIRMLKFVHIE